MSYGNARGLQVKVLERDAGLELNVEQDINAWLERNPAVEVLDIKFGYVGIAGREDEGGYGGFTHSVLLAYRGQAGVAARS